MKRFLVSYDLLSPGRDYNALTSALKALGASRVLLSQWVLKGNYTALQLRDHLRQYIDQNDRLLVNDFSDWASWGAMVDINKAA